MSLSLALPKEKANPYALSLTWLGFCYLTDGAQRGIRNPCLVQRGPFEPQSRVAAYWRPVEHLLQGPFEGANLFNILYSTVSTSLSVGHLLYSNSTPSKPLSVSYLTYRPPHHCPSPEWLMSFLIMPVTLVAVKNGLRESYTVSFYNLQVRLSHSHLFWHNCSLTLWLLKT